MAVGRLAMTRRMFGGLMAQLARRGQGRREAGAFLLADRRHPAGLLPVPVVAVAFYDDLDPDSLTGAITFHPAGFAALNARCRRDGLRVVGDIHTHPGPGVGQSGIDAAHPMVALDGHVALVAPRFAVGVTRARDLGVHVRTDGQWTSHFGRRAADVVRVGLWLSPTAWWRHLLAAIPHRINSWRNR